MYFDTVRQLRYEDRRGILRTCVLKECRDVIQRKNAALKPASDRSSAIAVCADLPLPGDKDVERPEILTVHSHSQKPPRRHFIGEVACLCDAFLFAQQLVGYFQRPLMPAEHPPAAVMQLFGDPVPVHKAQVPFFQD